MFEGARGLPEAGTLCGLEAQHATGACATMPGRPEPGQAGPARPRFDYQPGWTDRIPEELKSSRRWVVWRYEMRKGKWTKVLYQPRAFDGRYQRGKSNEAETWGPFAEAVRVLESARGRAAGGRFDGVGYVLAADDGVVGIDLDHCLTEDGRLEDWAAGWLDRLGATYTEVSPSGRGIKAFYRGRLPAKPNGTTGRQRDGYGQNRTGKIELYDRGRYFTVTGARWGEADGLADPAAGALDALVAELEAGRTVRPRVERDGRQCPDRSSPRVAKEKVEAVDPRHKATLDQMTDDDVLKWARHARNGQKFSSLFDHGDTSEYGSASEADCALLTMLAYWTGADPERMERLFGRSALADREKWKSRPDYRVRSIARAIELNNGAAPDLGWLRVENGVLADGPKPPPTSPRWQTVRSTELGAHATGHAGGASTSRGPDPESRAEDPELDKALSRLARTDLGNAERLVARFGCRIRWVERYGEWLVFDGRRWARDELGLVHRMAFETVRAIGAEARYVDGDEVKLVLSWANSSQARKKIDDMIVLARRLPGVSVTPDALDRDPWAFNVLNGTLDLRTGELKPHAAADLITKLSPVSYDPRRRAPGGTSSSARSSPATSRSAPSCGGCWGTR